MSTELSTLVNEWYRSHDEGPESPKLAQHMWKCFRFLGLDRLRLDHTKIQYACHVGTYLRLEPPTTEGLTGFRSLTPINESTLFQFYAPEVELLPDHEQAAAQAMFELAYGP